MRAGPPTPEGIRVGSPAAPGIIPDPAAAPRLGAPDRVVAHLSEELVIHKAKKTMVAALGARPKGASGGGERSGAKGPAANLSAGAKKSGRGGAVGKAFGVPSTKAKRPGGK